MPELKYKDITEKIIGASLKYISFWEMPAGKAGISRINLSKSFGLGVGAGRTILFKGN